MTRPSINYSFRSLKVGFISSIYLLPLNKSPVALYQLSNGAYSYIKPTQNSKLFILTLLVNNAFVLLYLLFFVLLFIGLFFYIQNIRFLHSTNSLSITPIHINAVEKNTLIYYYFTIIFLTLLLLGLLYIDDLLLIVIWFLM